MSSSNTTAKPFIMFEAQLKQQSRGTHKRVNQTNKESNRGCYSPHSQHANPLWAPLWPTIVIQTVATCKHKWAIIANLRNRCNKLPRQCLTGLCVHTYKQICSQIFVALRAQATRRTYTLTHLHTTYIIYNHQLRHAVKPKYLNHFRILKDRYTNLFTCP
jgi:hypothetical protein